MLHQFNQALIFVLAITAVRFLTLGTKRGAFIGSWVGLVSEPFWFYAGFIANQWAGMSLAVFFAFLYVKGIWTNRDWKEAT